AGGDARWGDVEGGGISSRRAQDDGECERVEGRSHGSGAAWVWRVLGLKDCSVQFAPGGAKPVPNGRRESGTERSDASVGVRGVEGANERGDAARQKFDAERSAPTAHRGLGFEA